MKASHVSQPILPLPALIDRLPLLLIPSSSAVLSLDLPVPDMNLQPTPLPQYWSNFTSSCRLQPQMYDGGHIARRTGVQRRSNVRCCTYIFGL